MAGRDICWGVLTRTSAPDAPAEAAAFPLRVALCAAAARRRRFRARAPPERVGVALDGVAGVERAGRGAAAAREPDGPRTPAPDPDRKSRASRSRRARNETRSPGAGASEVVVGRHPEKRKSSPDADRVEIPASRISSVHCVLSASDAVRVEALGRASLEVNGAPVRDPRGKTSRRLRDTV